MNHWTKSESDIKVYDGNNLMCITKERVVYPW
jgi:hypothetical protein